MKKPPLQMTARMPASPVWTAGGDGHPTIRKRGPGYREDAGGVEARRGQCPAPLCGCATRFQIKKPKSDCPARVGEVIRLPTAPSETATFLCREALSSAGTGRKF